MPSTGAQQQPISEPAARIWPESLLVFALSSAVYILLRSHDVVAVDGAIRAVITFNQTEIVLGTHMLHNLWVSQWMRLLALFGYHPADVIAYWRSSQILNGLAAATCTAFLYDIVRRTGGPALTAAFGAVAWGASHTVLLHATNSAEPVIGLLWSVLAFAFTLSATRLRSYALLVLAGVSLSIAMASYRSMVFMGLACGLIALLSPAHSRWEPFRRASILTGSFLLSSVAIFGYVAHLQGARGPSDAARLFVAIDSQSVYLALTPSKIVNAFVGYVTNFVAVVPNNYAGLRWLASHSPLHLLWLLLCLAAMLATTFFLIRRGIRDARLRAIVLSCGAAFLLGLLLVCVWVPTYEKLWLQPLWLMVVIASIVSTHVQLRKALAVGILLAAVINVAVAWKASRGPMLYFDDAQRLAGIIHENDLLVAGWSASSVVYRHTFGNAGHNFDFVYHAGADGARTVPMLTQEIAATRARDGRVYFLDILDQNDREWNAFLGQKCGVPYESLQTYREQAREVTRFPDNRDPAVRLMLLP